MTSTFSLQPTFTQGLLLGQLSILVLLALLLKYFFLDSTHNPLDAFSYHPRPDVISASTPSEDPNNHHQYSTEWLNVLLEQVSPRRYVVLHGL